MSLPEALVTQAEALEESLLPRLATEVRQALHNVLGSIEVISKESLSRRQAENLNRCRENLHKLLRVANDVSALADVARLNERSCPLNFSELLEGFSNLVARRAARKGVDWQWSIDRNVPRTVLGYRQAIETALYRLVDNSLEFTERGAITISVTCKILDGEFGNVSIEVGDTGPGIPQDVLDDLERPFSEMRNRGLGLRLARKQLAAIAGHLEVAASGIHGTRLAIVFPVTIPAQDSRDECDPGYPSRSLPVRLLVAEDSDDSFAVFETFVKDEGHHVTRAVNGAEAVDQFKSGTFDMVVMDVNMPVMDGYAATRAIRDWETKQGWARLPILLLSADDAAKQMRIGSVAGCSGYLTKPTPKQELLRALSYYSREGDLR